MCGEGHYREKQGALTGDLANIRMERWRWALKGRRRVSTEDRGHLEAERPQKAKARRLEQRLREARAGHSVSG